MDGLFREREAATQPPPHDAPYEVRAAWAEAYIAELSAADASLRRRQIDLPDDVRPTHLWEVEFQSAVLNPQEYARDVERRR